MVRSLSSALALGLLAGAMALPGTAVAQEFPTNTVYDQPLFPDVDASFRLRVA